MIEGNKITVTVFWRNYEGIVSKQKFNFIVYRVTNDNLFLGRDFYNEYGILPGAMHHEIEILGIKFMEFDNPVLFHFHDSIEGKRPFVCYPLPMPTIENVMEVLKIWCLGTALSMKWGFDFQHIFKGDAKEFFEILEMEYGLTI